MIPPMMRMHLLNICGSCSYQGKLIVAPSQEMPKVGELGRLGFSWVGIWLARFL